MGFGAVDREQILILWRERVEGGGGPPCMCGHQAKGGFKGLFRPRMVRKSGGRSDSLL